MSDSNVKELPFISREGVGTRSMPGQTPDIVKQALRDMLDLAETEEISAVSIAFVIERGGDTRFRSAYAYRGDKLADLFVAQSFAADAVKDDFRS
jgi:oligoribonuclease NrnB/cAMP/cGMP phosphodiesterase (DHH superfamily)